MNFDETAEVLAGACHLQMRTAIDLCSDFLLAEMTTANCTDVLNMADMFSVDRVKRSAARFIERNFEKLADIDGGCQLMKLQRDDLCDLLRSDSLAIATELALFRIVTLWIDADRTTRAPDGAAVLKHVRFTMMRPEELVDQVKLNDNM